MKTDLEKEVGESLLREYGTFFKKQYQDLCELGVHNALEPNNHFLQIVPVYNISEPVPVLDLVSSDNVVMTKILASFSTLCNEVIFLKKEANDSHFQFIAMYDEYESDGINMHMEGVCKLAAFTHRCQETLKNICSQLFALYGSALINLNGIQMHYIISHVSELFTILIVLEILLSNSKLPQIWRTHHKNMKSIINPQTSLGMTKDKLMALLNAAENINLKLMSDHIVEESVSKLLPLRQNLAEKNCAALAAEFTTYSKLAIINLEKVTSDVLDLQILHKCMKVNALFVLNSHLFGTNDKKLLKALADLNVKAHTIPLYGTSMWYPEQFLQRYIPALVTSQGRFLQSMVKSRQAFLNSKKNSITKDENSLHAISVHWALKIEESFKEGNDQLNASELSSRAQMLQDGLDIVTQTAFLIRTIVNLHVSQGIPLSRSVLMSIFRMLESLKAMKNAIKRNHVIIANSINMIVQHLTYQAIMIIIAIKKRLMTNKNYALQRLDELTCIVVAERALKGACSTERIVVANTALTLMPQTNDSEESYSRLAALLDKIENTKHWLTTMAALCSGSWLFWHKDVIPVYLQQDFVVKSDAIRLTYLFDILEDCGILLLKMDTLFNGNGFHNFKENISNFLNDSIMKTANQQVETNLRLHIHSHLQLDVANPFRTDMIKKTLFLLNNFRLLETYMSIIPSTEHYLSTMFYNLTTVVLSDWKTYGEMRQMAKFKFKLVTVDDFLPKQTLEQGLDVLEIMRNINVFVAKYLYNLNNQIFIEKGSNNKHLNSINIKHVANSIRTHGTGIMNTTVNFTYQFLRKKFYTFSQFLYDEQIKSRLSKELRNLREHCSENIYSYKHADRLKKAIRNLGLAENGMSYLDLFRDLISQVGNAMGYVRMIRSGGRHCCAEATVFLPKLDREVNFKELCENNGLSHLALTSAEILDNDIDCLISNFTQGTEYFQLLVDVFSPIFRNPKNVHLKHFYIIVPALTVNFVEHLIMAKDTMTKKNKVGAAFTDDGFAMGVAFILKLLDQNSDLDSLHWFESVWKHIEHERISLEDQKLKGSVQLQQALALTEKKLNILETEFQLLFYTLTSSRIFFN